MKPMNCMAVDEKLADLLLDSQAVPAEVQSHVDGCQQCRAKLGDLQATLALMDAWEAPEPSPYFLTRLDAVMREERQAAPAGWLARLRARMIYGSATHVRPIAAMAMTILLLLGGGAYLGVTDWNHPVTPQGQAAVVSDLENMDNNAQLLDQLESIGANDDGD